MDTGTTSLKPGFHMIAAKDLSDRSGNDRGDRNVVAAKRSYGDRALQTS